LLEDPNVNTVAIVTRHNLHARQVISAIKAGKNVFVEKPLCLTEDELQEVVAAHQEARANGAAPLVMVGYNRRFAPFLIELKEHLRGVHEPLLLTYRTNAGYIPPDHWIHDPEQGGGRLRGEGCHFIDLMCHLAGVAPRRVTTRALPDSGRYRQDNFVVTIEFANGTLGTVIYSANGDKGFGKETLEVFGGGLSARLEDYRFLNIRHGAKRIKREAKLRQDKGHKAEWQALVDHLTAGAASPIAFDDLVRSTQATLAAHRSLQEGETVEIPAAQSVD
jgi:predicted dehydrogenase